MMPLTDVIGLGSSAFVAAVIVHALLPLGRKPFAVRIGVLLAILGAMFIPVHGLIVAGYVRGVIADPSVTTILLAACIAARQVWRRELFDVRNLRATMLLVLLAGVILYPMAMGLGPYDPYALGFGSWVFYSALALAALFTWWQRLELPLLCIVGSVVVFAAGLTESTNLWNVLIDPLAVVLAAGWIVERTVRSALLKRRSTGVAV